MDNMTTTPSICFIDFLYPASCFENRWAIIDILTNSIKKYTGILPDFRCIPSDIIFGRTIDFNNPDIKLISDCIAFTGVESSSSTQIADVDMFVIGPSYNYSRDFVLPYQSAEISGDSRGDGWGFVKPLDWTVWLAMFFVILMAIGVQILMKTIEVDASPALDKETAAEIMSRSILSSVAYSRLYGGSSHIISRHLLSSCMAMFAVVIVSLYCSNLVNFFYMANDDRVILPQPSMVRVHPAFKDLISPETFGVYTDGANARLQITNMIQGGVYHENETPVVSRVVGDIFRNSTTKLRSLGGYYTVYEVVFMKTFGNIVGGETLKDIMIDTNRELDLYQFNKNRYLDFQDNDYDTLSQVDIQNVWGAFAILLVGYITSILFRVFFTEKTGLSNISLFKHPKNKRAQSIQFTRSNTSVPSTPHTEASTANVVAVAGSVYENAQSGISEIGMVEIELNERHSSITIEV
jgi:hypothetical protein